MARGQQKVILPKDDLPPVSKLSDGTYGYIVRYRIISEDQNRYSHWSPIRELAMPDPIPVAGDLIVNGGLVQAVWGDEEDRPNYDVFVKWDEADYIYHGTTPTHTYSFLLEMASTLQVAVQIESTNKERSALLEIWESAPYDLLELS